MFRSATLVATMLLAAQASAQSCPKADSVLGPETNGYVRSKYDKFTDSTTIESVPEGDFSFLSVEGGAVISFTAQYRGRSPSAPPKVSGKIVTIAAQEDRGAKPEMGMQKYQAVDVANVLLDDSVRLALPVAKHSAAIKGNDGVEAAMLLETLELTVTLDDLAKIGAANKAAIRFGENTKKFSGRVLKSIKEQARVAMCSGG